MITENPSSFIQVYALEAEYQAIKTEYASVMDRLNHTCVGKDKASAECVRAAQLNADMQTTLSAMSDTLKRTGAPKNSTTVVSQQKKLLDLADALEDDYAILTAGYKDGSVNTSMYKSHYLAWAIGLMFIGGVYWHSRLK